MQTIVQQAGIKDFAENWKTKKGTIQTHMVMGEIVSQLAVGSSVGNVLDPPETGGEGQGLYTAGASLLDGLQVCSRRQVADGSRDDHAHKDSTNNASATFPSLESFPYVLAPPTEDARTGVI